MTQRRAGGDPGSRSAAAPPHQRTARQSCALARSRSAAKRKYGEEVTTESAQLPEQVSARADDEIVRIEPRWPVALAISTFIAMSVALRVPQPHRESLGPPWLVPAIEIAMLV